MTQEQTRLDRALPVLDALEQPGAYPSRISAALPLLSGFELTAASDAVRDSIESLELKYNAIAQGYPPASPESPPELSEEDARELVVQLRQTCELIRQVETERILSRLRHHGGVLPEAEIIEARRHRDWFIPPLLHGCQEQVACVREFDNPDGFLPDDQHSSVPFFSLFLFSEWHVAYSIPVILEGLRLPGELPFQLFGDAVHEQVPHYLAQFLSDDLDQIDALISDSGVDLYTRWAAANSYQYLVRDQEISVDEAVARLDRLFYGTRIIGEDGRPGWGHPYELSAGILDVICSIGGTSRSTISADDENWAFVEVGIIDPQTFDERAASADDSEASAALRRLPPTRVEDCLEELRDWAAFTQEPQPVQQSPSSKPPERPEPAVLPPSVQSPPPAAEKPVEPIRRAERVPRNAPCPCGSGKKYKQCCLRKES